MEGLKWNRRSFIRKTGLTFAGLSVGSRLLAFTDNKIPLSRNTETLIKLTILHTNDMHSRIEPFPADHPLYPNLGGMARRAALIDEIRQERGKENVLLVDCGDIFQGTPYFNLYKGIPEFKIMSKMGYDAATMGNHDFDNGIQGFLDALPYANFPFVCSNYDFSETDLNEKTQTSLILKKSGISVGIIGLGVELEGLVSARNYGKTKYLNPIEVANRKAKKMKDSGCDLVVCLSHLGYEYETEKVSDLKLAEQTENIDLILGGHTHTFMKKIKKVKNKCGKAVYIHQVGWAGINLGRIDIEIDPENKGLNVCATHNKIMPKTT